MSGEETREQLIEELQRLRRQVAELQASESQLKQAEVELKRSKEFVETILNSMHDSISLIDVHDFRIVGVNRTFLKAVGMEEEEVIGKLCYEITHHRSAPCAPPDDVCPLLDVRITDEPSVVEHVHYDKDGRAMYVEVSVSPVRDDKGEVFQVVHVTRDITERKRGEAERGRLLAELERRALQLQTAAEVSRAANSILDADELIQQVVDLVRERFDLYYVGLFLLDDSRQYALLRAGTGEAGRQMLEMGHKLEVDGESVIGWCVTNAQARIALDVGEEASRFENPFLPETRSEIVLPLVSRGQVIGAMTCQSAQEAAFSDKDVAVFQTMADQLANAIDNARLFEEVQGRAEELAALNTIASIVSRSLDLRDFLQESLSEVIHVTGFEAGLVSLADEASGQLLLSIHSGLPEPMISHFEEVGLGGTLCDYVFQVGQTLGLGDLRDGAPVDVSGLLNHGIRSYLGAPLTHKGQSLGTVCIFSYSPQPLVATNSSLIAAIGQQIGVAVHNARLFEQTQKALARTAALYAGSNRMSRATTMQDVLLALIESTIVERLDRASLHLFDSPWDGNAPPKGMTVMAAWESGDREPLTPVGTYHAFAASPVAKLFTLHQPTVVNDLATDERFDEQVRKHFSETLNVRGLIALPLVVSEQSIGGIVVHSREPLAIDEDEMRHLASLTDQAAIVIQNQRLLEAAQRHAEQLTALFNTSRELASTFLQPDEIVASVARYLAELGRLECSFSLLEADGDTLRVLADIFIEEDGSIHDTKSDRAYHLSDYPATARVMETLQPLVVRASDPDADPAELAYMREYDIEMLVIIPLAVKGQAIGIMELEVSEERHYTPEQLDLMVTLARQAAVALENTRLFEEAQAHAERERLIREISDQIQRATDMETLMRITAEELNKALGGSRAYVRLGTEELQPLGGGDGQRA